MSAEARSLVPRRGLREITGAWEKATLPGLLESWGYVRPVPFEELDLAVVFAYGDDGLFWLIRDAAWQREGEGQIHLCAAPPAQGRIATRWALVAFEVIACLLGFTALHAPIREGAEWEPLLRRLGWTDEPRGPGPVRWLRRDIPPRPVSFASAGAETALGVRVGEAHGG